MYFGNLTILLLHIEDLVNDTRDCSFTLNLEVTFYVGEIYLVDVK